MNPYLQASLVFLCAFLVDGVWIMYLNAVKVKNAPGAAVWAAVLIILSGVNVVSYVENHWFLISAALGAAIGTYVFMRLHRE